MGLGLTEVRLPAAGRFAGEVNGAIGRMLILVPDGMAVRLVANTGMTLRDMPPEYQQDGNTYTSPDFQEAENRVELTLNQAMGGLTVQPAE
jgi:hypothetical protein